VILPDAGELISLLALGLVTGVFGGMLGVGGSIVMIPVLTLLFHRDTHLAQASAMTVNAFVAVPAMAHHHLAGAVRWDVVRRSLPAGLVAIVLGVAVSNLFDGQALLRVFGVFLVYVIITDLVKVIGMHAEPSGAGPRTTWPRCLLVGALMGFVGGVLGIGGGLVAVPLLQRLAHLPLRQSIATSAAVMCVTAVLGAIHKNATLAQHVDAAGEALRVQDGLVMVLCLAPTAILGSLLGARLTHGLPVRWVRLAFVVLLTYAAARMLGLW
jgi:hypothetical protein